MQFHGNLALALPHFIAGLIGLASGVVALAVLKGGPLHRKSGMIFAYAMLLVAVSGIVMATVRSQKLNLLGGLLTFYMVTTAVARVRRRVQQFHWAAIGALLLAVTIGVLGITFGIEASNSASGRIDGLPPAPAFMFGAVLLLAAMGDIRMMLRGLQGTQPIARHLWRMCFAFFSAASSFFPAQVPKMFPALGRPGWLWVPSVLVLSLMLWWLWHVRVRNSLRGVAAHTSA